MLQRGRKSAENLAVVALPDRSRLRPRPEAPPEVGECFREVVASMPGGHFQPSDAPLLEAFAQSIVLSRQAYKALASKGQVVGGRMNQWVNVLEKCNRTMASLSMRLRLAPQARMRLDAVKDEPKGGSFYDANS
jgi:phage terminase small subunit